LEAIDCSSWLLLYTSGLEEEYGDVGEASSCRVVEKERHKVRNLFSINAELNSAPCLLTPFSQHLLPFFAPHLFGHVRVSESNRIESNRTESHSEHPGHTSATLVS
jgi:hypothetical protein